MGRAQEAIENAYPLLRDWLREKQIRPGGDSETCVRRMEQLQQPASYAQFCEEYERGRAKRRAETAPLEGSDADWSDSDKLHWIRQGGGDASAAILGLESGQITMEALKKKLQDEIVALEHEFRSELPKEILRARELGDLSENAEYHAAKERQGMVNARLGQLRKRLAELSMIDLTKVPRDRVGFGSTVVVFDILKATEMTYRLVASEESDVKKGLISTSSPIGRGLLNKKVGDEVRIVAPGATLQYEVVRMTTLHGDVIE